MVRFDESKIISIDEEHWQEDDGIGDYECHGFRGHDSRPCIEGVISYRLPNEYASISDSDLEEMRRALIAHASKGEDVLGEEPEWLDDIDKEVQKDGTVLFHISYSAGVIWDEPDFDYPE